MPAVQAATTSASSPAATPDSLLQAWLSYPQAVDVQWPHAFMSADSTADSGQSARQDLFAEFERLRWRLEESGYADLASTLDVWKTRLSAIDTFRVPGDWSPSFLLAHPNQQPPIARVAAIGSCQAPQTVGVWSAAGYDAVTWHSGMQLSDLERRVPALRHGSAPEIAVVDAYGHIDRYGVQAWNYADGPVSPGDQVVASLPLKGDAFEWIRDSMADLLAHTPSGVNCRQEKISGDTESDHAGT